MARQFFCVDLKRILFYLYFAMENKKHKYTFAQREQIIREKSSPALLEEMEFLLDEAINEGWEFITDLYETFRWVSEKADSFEDWVHLRTATRKVHIALGEYVAMSPEQVRDTVSTHGKVWAFKMNKIPYQWEGPNEY